MVRETASETLGQSKNPVQSADQLIKALGDEFWQVRLKATRSLGIMKVERAVGPIARSLLHEQANLRKEAAAALGEIADLAAKPALEAVADDPDPEVRKNARWALQRIAAANAGVG
jgi:HEAT repeat protein